MTSHVEVSRFGRPWWYPLVVCLAVAAVVTAGLAAVFRPFATPADAVAIIDLVGQDIVAAALAFRLPLRWASVLGLLVRAGVALGLIVWASRPARSASGHQIERAAETNQPEARRGWRRALRLGGVGAGAWALVDVCLLPIRIWAWQRSVDVGLSTQDGPSWVRDLILQSVPVWVGVAIGVAVFVVLRERLTRGFVPVMGLLAGFAGVVLVVVTPVLFEPLFFTFTPVPDGSLRDGIQSLAQAEGVDAQILIADASRRTTAANAYVSGLGSTRRIVLYDTLIAETPTPTILATVAHELAHRTNHDVERAAAGVLGVAVLGVWLADRVSRRVQAPRVGLDPRGVVTVLAVLMLAGVVLEPVGLAVSRQAEAAADAQALDTLGESGAYRTMLVTLARRNLSDPDPPGWMVALFYSHPPMPARIGRTLDDQRQDASS